jgi:hypothetical protein
LRRKCGKEVFFSCDVGSIRIQLSAEKRQLEFANLESYGSVPLTKKSINWLFTKEYIVKPIESERMPHVQLFFSEANF